MSLPGQVYIVGGMYKRTKLPVAQQAGLRPTPARVRETLFNWLGQDLKGWRCLDVFAGTGALGFEAASRGASQVLLCEQNPKQAAQLQALQTKLNAPGVHIARGDGVALLKKQTPEHWHLVFLDPPFEANLWQPALQAAHPALVAQGWLYLEAPRPWQQDELGALGFTLVRSSKAGAVHFHLLRKTGP